MSRLLKLTLPLLVVLVLCVPVLSRAATNTEIQAQIQALVAQIAALQAQLVNEGGSSSGGTTPTVVTSPNMTCVYILHSLALGSNDSTTDGDVSKLQQFLKYSTTYYANGQVSGYYGPATQQAVRQWQSEQGIVTPGTAGSGSVGPRTRAVITTSCHPTPTPLPQPQPISPLTLTVTAPNGGEQWEEGVLNSITWSPYGYSPDVNPAGDVTAYLEKKTIFGNFTTVGQVYEEGKASIHTYLHIKGPNGVLDTYPDPGQYYVRIVNSKTGEQDRSDQPFTILPPTLTLSVNGSHSPGVIADNQPITISWSARANVQNCVISNTRAFSGANVASIAVESSGTRQVYASVSSYGGNVMIQCQRIGTSDYYLYDIVNFIAPATSAATLSVLSPNGTDQIPLDTSAGYTIAWNQKGLSNVSIALYKNDQWQSWISKGVTSDKSVNDTYTFPWGPKSGSIPDAVASGKVFKIYITGQKADGSGYVDDKSDAPFSFTSTSNPNTGRISADLKVNVSDGPVNVSDGQLIHVSWSSSGADHCQLGNIRLTSTGTATTLYNLPSSGTREVYAVGQGSVAGWIDSFVSLGCYSGTGAEQAPTTFNSAVDMVTVRNVTPTQPTPGTANTTCTYTSHVGTAPRTATPSQSNTESTCVTACTTIRNEVFGLSDYGTCSFTSSGQTQTFQIPSGVIVAPPPLPKPSTCTITASKTSVAVGEQYTLTWTTNNISSPVMYQIQKAGGTVSIPANGSMTMVTPYVGTDTFRIGSGGIANNDNYYCSVSVTATTSTNPVANEVQAVGVYQGAYTAGTASSFGYHPTGAASVHVTGTPSSPATLVLTSYEPVHWYVSEDSPTELARIIMVGYYDQQVTITNGNTNIPIESHSYTSDGVFQYAYSNTGEAFNKLNTWLTSKGFPITTFTGSYSGSNFTVYLGAKGEADKTTQLASAIAALQSLIAALQSFGK